MSDWRQVAEIAQRQRVSVDADDSVDADRRIAGRSQLQTELAKARPIDLEKLDVDHDLRPCLVDRGDDLAGGRDPFRRVLDHDRVGRRDRRHAPGVDHDAEQVHRLLEIGIAEEEGAHDLLLVFLPLGRRVRNHRDRALGGDAVEVACRRRDGLQRLFERRVPEVDAHRLRAELRVEDDVHVGDLAERREDVARIGLAERHRVRHPDIGRQLLARRHQLPGAFDERLELGLAVARRDLVAELRANVAQQSRRSRRCRGSTRRRSATRRAPRPALPVASSRRPREKWSSEERILADFEGLSCRRDCRGPRAAPWCTRRSRGRSLWP